MQTAKTRALLTVDEAAEQLAIKRPTVRAWMARRKIGYVRLGRAVRIPASEIDRLLEQGTVPAVRAR
jgi:excisionase family DNA binding protein